MAIHTIDKPVKPIELINLIDDAITLCNNLSCEFHSNPYIQKFSEILVKKFETIKYQIYKMMQEPRLDWLAIEKEIIRLCRLDPEVGGFMLNIAFSGSRNEHRLFLKGEMVKSV